MLDFLSDSDEATAEGVLAFIQEAIQQYPRLKGSVVGRLLDVFGVIKSVKLVLKLISFVHRLYIHVNGLATLYKIFRHSPYGHVIKLRVYATAVISLLKLTNQRYSGVAQVCRDAAACEFLPLPLHPNIIVHVENVVSLFSSPSTSSQKVQKCGGHDFLSQAI